MAVSIAGVFWQPVSLIRECHRGVASFRYSEVFGLGERMVNFEYKANIYALPDGDDGVSRARSAARAFRRARSAARAYRGWSSIISVVGCAPPNTRRAVRLGGTAPARGFKGLELGNPR